MRRVIIATCAVIGLLHTFAPRVAAAPLTYEYTGEFFNFCGFGCPDHAPSDPRGADYLIATLTFDDPLAANLTFADDVVSLLTGWTLTDAFGSFYASSANGNDTLDTLLLGTDSGGNIVAWQMYVLDNTTEAGIANPPILCPVGECDDFIDLYISDFASVNLFLEEQLEWDSGVVSESPEGLPGQWSPAEVPEPASLLLFGTGAAGVFLRRKRGKKSEPIN
jgi:hypothetical protein